jgi:hypothetical protein
VILAHFGAASREHERKRGTRPLVEQTTVVDTDPTYEHRRAGELSIVTNGDEQSVQRLFVGCGEGGSNP